MKTSSVHGSPPNAPLQISSFKMRLFETGLPFFDEPAVAKFAPYNF
jgi:hypothetical protein